ncbi:polysaccharide biosynthesis tyrosine autokinase [Derxia lacustris]|uniref:polysaccharide biosynthesis tyrosine autokinase n=1 Tax=Derxia lacustris TaxID=764842 RepID=UPI001593DB39|nr:polysaccharide biosynthesis tyrosine autokinase [Derxia lacustris]
MNEQTIFLDQPRGATRPVNAFSTEKPLGRILKELLGLSDEQLAEISRHQAEQGIRFGEAAIALNYARSEDVLWAVAQQFQYHYTPAKSTPSIHAELIVATAPFSDEAEKFRAFRTQLMLGATATSKRPVISVASLDSGDGKTYFAANLATSFSQLGARTLLIDANMRAPRLHSLFGCETDSGLSAALLKGRLHTDDIVGLPYLPNLFVLPAGSIPPNPLELLQRPELARLIDVAQERFDHVIIDTPAASLGADARVITVECSNCLVMTRKGVTRAGALKNFLNDLKRDGPASLAAILNSN